MMRKLLMPAAVAAIPVIISGSFSSSAQASPPDETTCLNISFAKDMLMMSTTPQTARGYADELEKYNPPDTVRAAIEHFVTTGGASFGDPDNKTYDLPIATWLKQMCPNVTTY